MDPYPVGSSCCCCLVYPGAFFYQVVKASRLVLKGKPENRFDNWGARISEVLTGWLGQKKVLKDRIAGGIHVLMFWGFLMLSTDMFDLASGNQFSQKVLPELVRGPWNLMVEIGYIIAFVGCVLALVRRVVFTPEKLKGKSQLEGNVILLLIMTITTTSFVVEAGESTVSPRGNPSVLGLPRRWSPRPARWSLLIGPTCSRSVCSSS